MRTERFGQALSASVAWAAGATAAVKTINIPISLPMAVHLSFRFTMPDA
jgi:hypothetical protein